MPKETLMNIKKTILSLVVVAGLTVSCVPQAQANNWVSAAGLVTGLRAGFCIPILVANPANYVIDTFRTGIITLGGALILSLASGSSLDLNQVLGSPTVPSYFKDGFGGGFAIGIVPWIALLAITSTGIIVA